MSVHDLKHLSKVQLTALHGKHFNEGQNMGVSIHAVYMFSYLRSISLQVEDNLSSSSSIQNKTQRNQHTSQSCFFSTLSFP